jgi:hypothetical protein
MSRFDELNQLFDPWRDNWGRQVREHQMLPLRIAKRFQEYLGCPETFSDGMPGSSRTERYVAATRAIWDGNERKFTLSVSNGGFDDPTFHEDGFFYFGLRVCLEHSAQIFPKQPFWFLFRSRFDGARFFLRVQRSEEFDIGAFPDIQTDDLSAHLFELLKQDLSKSPMIGAVPNKIGFT